MVRGKHYLFAAFAFLFLFIASTTSQAIPVKATITQIVGDVQVQPPGGSWQPAKEGAMVANGTQIKTGAKSSCSLRWSSQNTMKLTPYTQFTVKSIDVDPRSKTVKSDMDMFAGKVKLRAEKLQNPNSRFEVTTPSAVAGVRGTMGDLEQQADTLTGSTRDGMMEYEDNTGNTTTAGPGEQVKITTDGGLQEKTTVTEDQMNACTDDNECSSMKCVDGKCVGENESLNSSSACSVIGSACSDTVKCCNGYACGADGLCVEGEKTAAAAACVKDEEVCDTDEQCCSGACEEGKCLKTDANSAKISCTLTAESEEFPLSADKFTVKGASIAGAKCDVNGQSADVADDGTFAAEISFDAAGELEIACTCTDEGGNSAGGGLTINIKGPPELMISSPSEGFIACPRVDIAGQTEAGSVVNLNGSSLFDLSDAQVYSDGGFSFDGYELPDCNSPLDFETVDSYGQVTKVTINPGTSRVGIDFESVSVNLKPSGQWVDGLTTVAAKVIAKASTPIPPGMIVHLDSPNFGSLGDGLLQSYDAVLKQSTQFTEANTGIYYAVAEIVFQSGPAYPLSVTAAVGGWTSEPSSVFLDDSALAGCVAQPQVAGNSGDGIDNDCDGNVDEEIRDGLDEDWDGRVDEDLKCNMNNPDRDCDHDGVANGQDCIPFDAAVSITVENPECERSYALIKNQIDAGTIAEPDDGRDNDGDGRYDEEAIDGLDNDGDGLIDEDVTAYCDPYLEKADCDYDGTLNGDDCRPLDPEVKFTKDAVDATGNKLCEMRCDPFKDLEYDCDKDGLANGEELQFGTDPNGQDTDGDGFLDGNEVTFGSDPRDPQSMPEKIDTALLAGGSCAGGAINAAGQCECPGGVILQNATASCICMDGKVLLDDGSCVCPSGTMWNSETTQCEQAEWRTLCKGGVYFDYNVNSCVTTCTGGQEPNDLSGECQCPSDKRYMDPEKGECVTGCPAGFVANEYGECKCPDTAPLFDPMAGACTAVCSDGQVGDPMLGECRCPPGTFMNADATGNQSCVGTDDLSEGRCDPFADPTGDCDRDGLTNQEELENFGTNPFGADTDGDGYTDGHEVAEGGDPNYAGSYPGAAEKDSDGDGYPDSMENYFGSDSNDPASTPAALANGCSAFVDEGNCYSSPACFWDSWQGKCLAAISSMDSDGDGYPDDVENANGTDATDPASFPGAVEAGGCPGGQIKLEDTGECVCPPGTVYDPTIEACAMSDWSKCQPGEVMDWAIGACSTSCSGGQTADTMTSECYCPAGAFMDYSTGQCSAGCPAGMQPMGAECVCAPPTVFDGFAGACSATCSGGQVPDPYYPVCYCPPGTFYGTDENGNQQCVGSEDMTGGRCDAFGDPTGDCDQDGLSNQEELEYYGTNPFNFDTDADGYGDGQEIFQAGTNPTDPGSFPVEEVDTDGDGYPDHVENYYGSLPNDPASTPATVGAISASDMDGDGYPDEIEWQMGTDPKNALSYPGAAMGVGCVVNTNEADCNVNPECVWDAAMTDCKSLYGSCPGGQIMIDGVCACPPDTVFDPAVNACVQSGWTKCQPGEFMDWTVNACTTACSGGQTGDPYSGDCYCPNGTFMDYNTGQCASGCPAGTVAMGAECVCAPPTVFDPFVGVCADMCSGGQVPDPYFPSCYCPPGTFSGNDANGNQICVGSGDMTGGRCDAFADPAGDCDQDGLMNQEELNYFGTNPYSADSDGDSYGDGYEVLKGANPNDPGSYPVEDVDTDGDGYPDSAEGYYGSDPNDAASTPVTVGAINGYDGDGDGYPDEIEFAMGTDPNNPYSFPGAEMGAGCVVNTTEATCNMDPSCTWDAAVSDCKSLYGGCPGGQVMLSDGTCSCPPGTIFNPDINACLQNNTSQCAPGEFMDWAVGYCVTACSGGQTGDAFSGDCYCPSGTFMDYSTGQCSAGCPAGMVPMGAECGCPADAPNYDPLANSCTFICSGGQQADPYSGQCFCPPGTYLDWGMGACVETTSQTICPFGTSGGGCDYYRIGDCDFDGMPNSEDAEPCMSSGQTTCPMDSDGAGCSRIDPAIDCDGDNALNEFDFCPCMYGTSGNDFCPGGATSCPDGMFIDQLSGQCVSVCADGFVGDPNTGTCNCAPGTFMDPVTGYCAAGCPEGTTPNSYNECVCAAGTYYDDMTNTCVTQCSSGKIAVDDPNYPYCACPQGSYFDYGTNMCEIMQGCGTAPYALGCGCQTGPDCQSGFCDPWNQMCAPPQTDCSVFSTDAECAGTMDCLWDGMQNRCVSSMGDPCMPNADQASCDTHSTEGCVWDGVQCTFGGNGGGSGCDAFTTDATCPSPDCMWNFNQNLCVMAGGSGGGCGDFTTDTTCPSPDCIWNPDTSQCIMAGTSCSNYFDQQGCSLNGCVWDSMSNTCNSSGNGGGSNCSAFVTDSTCSIEPGCMWDWSKNECLMSGGGGCTSMPYALDCACTQHNECASGLCDMNGSGNLVCIDSCTVLPYPTSCGCTMDTDCESGYCDPGTNVCMMNQGGDCPSYFDQNSCEMGNCLWNGVTCDFPAPDCPSFNDINCPAPDCTWDTGASLCLDTSAVCMNSFDQTSCEATNGCFWNMGMGVCEFGSGGCGVEPYAIGCACTDGMQCESNFCDFGNGSVCGDACAAPAPHPEGCSCASGTECQSGTCDPGNWTCVLDCGSAPYANECACSSGTECQSGFCDMGQSLCKPDCSTPPYDNGCACSSGTECASNECNSCDNICVQSPPFDDDSDTVPNACDVCPGVYGDPAFQGCPQNCQTCP